MAKMLNQFDLSQIAKGNWFIMNLTFYFQKKIICTPTSRAIRVCGFVSIFVLWMINTQTRASFYSFLLHLLPYLCILCHGTVSNSTNHIMRLYHMLYSCIYFWRFCGRNRALWIVSDLFATWYLYPSLSHSPNTYEFVYKNNKMLSEKSNASIIISGLCAVLFSGAVFYVWAIMPQ